MSRSGRGRPPTSICVDDPASNAVCRTAGLTLLGAEEFESTPGNVVHLDDWVVELAPRGGDSA